MPVLTSEDQLIPRSTLRHRPIGSYQPALCGIIRARSSRDQEKRAMSRRTRAAFHLSIEEVKERMMNDPHSLYRKRWFIIYNALVDPREAKEIAKHTGVSVATVHKLISSYNKLGVAAVETVGKGGRRNAYMTFEEEQELLLPFFERARQGEITTIALIKQTFEERVGHKVDETTISRLLDRHEWRKLVPRPFHPKADKEEQRRFEQDFPKLVEKALASRDPKDERPVLKMAQDEACFGRISTIIRSWAPKPIRPLTPRDIVREYIYVYTAVAPKEGKIVSLILPYANTSMMNLFLQHVSQTFSDYFLVMQVDQAGWHSAKDLVIPENIRLIPQPAYSPELNPVEHIWDDLREKSFSNRSFASLDAVIDTLCDQLQQLERNSEYLRSMTYFPHFKKAS
jgi:transposase